MKRALLIPLIVLMMASMACSLFSPKPAEPTPTPAAPTANIALEPTETAVEAIEATAPPAEQPTDTEIAPTETEIPATEAPAAPAATETAPKPSSFKDTFDRTNPDWSKPVIVTSQAAGHEPYVKISIDSGVMRFAISDKETYVYKFLPNSPDGATTIEADFQNVGALDTGIALVCKANTDYTSWYEMRISAYDNYYHFYKYDKTRKEKEGKNPYLELGKGHVKVDEYYPTKQNHIVFSCTNNALTLDFNNGKKKAWLALDSSLDGNILGVGVMSSALIPATIDFDTISVH